MEREQILFAYDSTSTAILGDKNKLEIRKIAKTHKKIKSSKRARIKVKFKALTKFVQSKFPSRASLRTTRDSLLSTISV